MCALRIHYHEFHNITYLRSCKNEVCTYKLSCAVVYLCPTTLLFFFYPKITVNIYLHVCATGSEVVSSVLGCVHFSVEWLKINYLAFTKFFIAGLKKTCLVYHVLVESLEVKNLVLVWITDFRILFLVLRCMKATRSEKS